MIIFLCPLQLPRPGHSQKKSHDKGSGGNGIAKLLRHRLRIGIADAKRHQRPHIAKYCLAYRLRQLVNVLVREREAQPILARFCQDGGKGIRREVLELVNEEVEVPAFGFRPIRPRHRAKLELRHQKRAKQIRLVMPKLALGQVGDEQPSVVHHEGYVHLLLHLAQNVPHDGIQ